MLLRSSEELISLNTGDMVVMHIIGTRREHMAIILNGFCFKEHCIKLFDN